MSRLRDRAPDGGSRGLAQNAVGLAVGVAIDLAALGIAAGDGDARQLQGAGIRNRDVPVDALQKNRMAAGNLVNVPAGGNGLHGPQVFVPAPAENPLAGCRLLNSRTNALAEFLQRLHAGQIYIQPIKTPGRQVGVRVIKTGHEELPAQIDDLRGRPLQLEDIGVFADGLNAVAADCNGLGAPDRFESRHLHDAGVDIAMNEDGVGSRRRGLLLRPCRRNG